MKKLLLVVGCWLLVTAANANVDSSLVQRAETYLNSITGLVGDFEQISGGKTERGVFSMLRPGRVRLDYKNSPVQLIADGKDLYFIDKSLDQITTVPLNATPAGILVRKNINLANHDIVVAETTQNKHSFSLKMHIKDAAGMGYMLMEFNNNPVRMNGWTVVDATGTSTEIKFSNMKTKTDFGRNFFQVQGMRTTNMAGGDSFFD
jgi:outer membrane lipoprotein-sorting protein